MGPVGLAFVNDAHKSTQNRTTCSAVPHRTAQHSIECVRVCAGQLPRAVAANARGLSALDGPVIDPTRALEAAAEKGAVWEGAVYAILNRVIERDPTAWVTDDLHVFRGQ